MIRELSKQEAYDLVIGAKILANGGGGSEKQALNLIDEVYNMEKNFKLASLSSLKKNDLLCIIGLVGGGISEEDKDVVKDLQSVIKNPMISAVAVLEDYIGIQFTGFIATELGPNNSIIPLYTAALMDRIVVDGDCCGRSKPKISISTTTVKNIPIFPFSICSEFGDKIIVEETVDDSRGEYIARVISRFSDGHIGVARCSMTGQQAEEAIIPNTLSKAIKLGKIVREATRDNKNPIQAILNAIPEACLVFEGKITKFNRTEEGGFTFGIIELRNDNNHFFKVFYQNEYLLTWFDKKQFISCPDSIIIVDEKTGLGLTPWEDDFKINRKVVVLAIDAPKIWRTKRGLEVFGPKNFQKDWISYTPATKLVSQKSS